MWICYTTFVKDSCVDPRMEFVFSQVKSTTVSVALEKFVVWGIKDKKTVKILFQEKSSTDIWVLINT